VFTDCFKYKQAKVKYIQLCV